VNPEPQGWLAYALMGKSILVLAWLLAIVLIENRWRAAIVPLRIAGYGFAWFARWGRNLGFLALNAGLAPVLALPVTFYAAAHPLWSRPAFLAFPYALPLDLLLLDLWIYWWHRANHEIPLLWRFHQVHHFDEMLDSTSALRFHFGEVVLSALVRAGVIIGFDIPLSSVLLFEALVLMSTIFHHSDARLPERLEQTLARVIITPSIHWVHHHALRADTDSNYGTIFSFWDPLFRSNSLTKRWRAMPIGVEGRPDRPLLRLLVTPFWR
jgi:sterol desaturase/sphingolipid hydroxylase (fatty acid hydroxylase superfamily)